MSARFVYAIVPAAAEPPALVGIGEPPADVHKVVSGELAALVSEIPDDATPGTRADIAAHATVLATLVEDGVTTVPMRFGIVIDGEDAVREQLLDRHRDELLEFVKKLDGRVQVTLKAIYDEGALLREVSAANPRIAQLSEQTRGRPEDPSIHQAKVELGQLVADGVERKRAADEEAVIGRVEPLAEDIIVEEPRHERIAVHAQLLLHRERLEDLDGVLAQLTEELGTRMTFRAIGPLAPWSFADMSLDQHEEAWA